MDDIICMKIQKCLTNLIDDIFLMAFFKDFSFVILSDEVMEINVQILKHQIDVHILIRFMEFSEFDNIWVFELFQEKNLTINPLCVC